MICPKDGVKLRNIEISVENPPSSSEDPDRVETVVNMKIAFASPAEAITISIPIRTLVSPVTFTFPGEDGVDAERAADLIPPSSRCVPPGYSVWHIPVQVLERDGLSILHPWCAYEPEWGEHHYSSELAAIDACHEHAATKGP